jgi:transposase InsO family protein
MIAAVQSVKQTTGKPYLAVCRELAVPYASLMRWKRRQASGAAVIQRPGPGKVGPLDLHALAAQIRQLACGRERTHGTGALYAQHRTAISRRDLRSLVAAVRDEVQRAKQALARRIAWLVPSLIWSMDDAEIETSDGRLVHLHVVHDLGSRYTLCVLGDDALADGWTIARNLAALFKRYGAPLFFKRDNGSNLNHAAVNELLGERGVIPINSPPHYPPYNGAMEHKQREIKEHLASRFGTGPADIPAFCLAAEICGHDLNHLRRPILEHRTACCALESGRPILRQFHMRKRKEVFEAIKMLAVDIEAQLGQHIHTDEEVSFRYAAESWMQFNNIIRVSRNGQVLPPLYRFQSH